MPTIAELEQAMDDGVDLEILPNGEVVERSRLPDPPFHGQIIVVGDDHASIYWTGDHWSRDASHAKVYADWREAKRWMARLRNSSGTTIRTTSVGREPTPRNAKASRDQEGDTDG